MVYAWNRFIHNILELMADNRKQKKCRGNKYNLKVNGRKVNFKKFYYLLRMSFEAQMKHLNSKP